MRGEVCLRTTKGDMSSILFTTQTRLLHQNFTQSHFGQALSRVPPTAQHCRDRSVHLMEPMRSEKATVDSGPVRPTKAMGSLGVFWGVV